MTNETDPQWLEDYASLVSQEKELKTDREREIADQFKNLLAEQNWNLQLNANPVPLLGVDFFTPVSHHRQVEEILDIYKYVAPFISLPSIATMALGYASNATSRSSFSAPQWMAPNYATQAIADVNMGKMTAIAHIDQWTGGNANNSNAFMELTTLPMDKNYTTLGLILNYLFDYKLEYIFNPATSNHFSDQKVILSLNVKEFYPNGMESGRLGLPTNEILYEYKHQYIGPNAPMNFSSQQKPQQYLKKIEIPNVVTGYYYKVIVELHTYSWLVEGKAANEANFSLISAA